MSLKMASQGVYWSIQGEGHMAGHPMTFVRLAGCSVGCPQCDTNYRHVEDMSAADIVGECQRIHDETGRGKYVWITGGEPTDQDLSTLNNLLWRADLKPCLATSGVRKVGLPWWILSVSPHSVDFQQRGGSELKLIHGLNGLDIEAVDLSGVSFAYKFVQPMAGDRESTRACLRFMQSRKDFLMSPQYHKEWLLP